MWEAMSGQEEAGLSRAESVADALLGLLFAAHKNATISSAQALCFLSLRPDLLYPPLPTFIHFPANISIHLLILPLLLSFLF